MKEGDAEARVSSIYYEPQQAKNSCFLHATNMYFQKKYLDEKFMPTYSELLQSFSEKITKLKDDGAGISFYGNQFASKREFCENSSEVTENEDLFGYYEIYKSMQVEDFLQSLRESNFIELSPPWAQFLLEFSLNFQSLPKGNKVVLQYTPHRFLHRHVRDASETDQEKSRKMFENVVQEHRAKKVYLCRVELGKSHAFAAIRNPQEEGSQNGSANSQNGATNSQNGATNSQNAEWVLLDSLVGATVMVPDTEVMFTDPQYGARASVLILPDAKRGIVTIGEKIFEE